MLAFKPGQAVPLADVPEFSRQDFHAAAARALADGSRLVSFFGLPAASCVELLAVFADASAGLLRAARMTPGSGFPSLTPEHPQAHLFEREIHEEWGIVPQGHPWLKPIRFMEPRRGGSRPEPCVTDFFRVEGEGVHEVAVGPIHAGVIEPGHFRFQCHGEEVFLLQIALGYQHRGVERRLEGGPDRLSRHLLETVAGDTTIGHSWAHAQVLEALAGTDAPPRARHLRALALELERLANHTGDLGALSGDVGYLPPASFCGRLRGDFLNLTALICGSRFGRGLVRPGGAGFDIDPERTALLRDRLQRTVRDVTGAANLLFDCPSVRARFEHTGTLSRRTARDLGLVGPVARACGLEMDTRADFPLEPYDGRFPGPAVEDDGDVQARAMVRWLELQQSAALADALLADLPGGPVLADPGRLAPSRLAVGLVEGWRGEVCHVALTGEDGRIRRYKITDPSFHNWFGLSVALRGQQVSDFPLCNKSFNLSYCGHDL